MPSWHPTENTHPNVEINTSLVMGFHLWHCRIARKGEMGKYY
jgi:hypothetical protein